MKKYFWFVGALVILAGCVPSLHPLYTDKDTVFELALLGKWSEKDSKATWTFTKGNKKQYNLVLDSRICVARVSHVLPVVGPLRRLLRAVGCSAPGRV